VADGADSHHDDSMAAFATVSSMPEGEKLIILIDGRGIGRRSTSMPVFNKDIFRLAEENTFFRQEILTNEHSQIVLMSVEPGDDIGDEVHEVDQILVFVAGKGEAVLNRERTEVNAHSLVAVPAGTRHNFINTGKQPLKLFTIYSPPEEEPGTVHRTKAEATAAEAD
jgi:mannose-6-phosphate isomerase-like protein (cupin superfamily)